MVCKPAATGSLLSKLRLQGFVGNAWTGAPLYADDVVQRVQPCLHVGSIYIYSKQCFPTYNDIFTLT